MIEQLVSRYYSEDWDHFAVQQGNQIIQENLVQAKKLMDEQLWTKLSEGWFHDAYIMQLHCNNSRTLSIKIKKHNEIVRIHFSSVSLFECVGTLLDSYALFPNPDGDHPIAQILDIWVELRNEVTMLILLDNGRYLKIRSSPNQFITCLKR